MYSMHEEVHIGGWPSFSIYPGAAYALGPEVNLAASRMYAVEGQCFVLAACATVSSAMLEELADSEAKQQLLGAGGGYAMAFGPDGRPLGEPLGEDEEGLLITEIDRHQIALAKSVADPVGHYSRPDVTRLLINRQSTPVVQSMDAYFDSGDGNVFEAVQEPESAGRSEEIGGSTG
jgi:aliphatic nitrilase